MLPKEYRTITDLSGPLMMVEKVADVRFDELVEIELASGERRRGRVLEITTDRALVQVFEGTTGIDLNATKVRFLGKVLTLPVAKEMMGRIFNGRGEPIDGGDQILAKKRLDVNGFPINPYSRDFPSEFIQTGISTIDGMNPIVRGQKLPIFSGSGLPHNRIAAQVADRAFGYVDAPIQRVCSPSVPPPFARNMEDFIMIDENKIADRVRRLVRGEI